MLYSYKELPKLRQSLKGKNVVFVSGCFDIVHRGHVEFLEKAATYGDVLVVGVLADEYVETKKKRTAVHTQRQRARVVQALKGVAHVILTPYKEGPYPSLHILRVLRPQIFFRREKTHAYLPIREELEGLGIVLTALPMKKTHSTTRTIKRIQKMQHRAK